MTRTTETAVQLDSAIDTLLGDPSRPSGVAEGGLAEGGLAETARLLRDSLPRLHPRFSFEEHLAARLAMAGRRSAPLAPAEPTPFHAGMAVEVQAIALPLSGADRRRRSLLAGGAIASGVSLALPLAGAALVVWRRSRSSGGLL